MQTNSGILQPESDLVCMGDSPQFQSTLSWAELNNLSDPEVMGCLVAGDHCSLAVLFDRYHRLVYFVALRILRDEGEAEDVVQTVFLNIFEDAINFDPLKGTLKVWLLQYAYHRAINKRRSLAAQGVYLWEQLDSASERSEAPELETARYCEEMLMKLRPLQRQILELTYFEGWTAQEIADFQHRPAGQVRNDLYRSLAKLRSLVTGSLRRGTDREAKAQKGAAQVADTRTF
jgi:RNA polymerase sigma-70 factor (ECF subfamily)